MHPSEKSVAPAVRASLHRARQHVDAFVGLDAEAARKLAREMDVRIKELRPGAVVSAEFVVGRINLSFDSNGHVVRAVVSG